VLLRRHHLDPRRGALADDMLENLRTAKRLGMATVWVSPARHSPPFVDLRITSVTQLPGLVFRYSR
jgi:putative hydrolase of the HAD superfamily